MVCYKAKQDRLVAVVKAAARVRECTIMGAVPAPHDERALDEALRDIQPEDLA